MNFAGRSLRPRLQSTEVPLQRGDMATTEKTVRDPTHKLNRRYEIDTKTAVSVVGASGDPRTAANRPAPSNNEDGCSSRHRATGPSMSRSGLEADQLRHDRTFRSG